MNKPGFMIWLRQSERYQSIRAIRLAAFATPQADGGQCDANQPPGCRFGSKETANFASRTKERVYVQISLPCVESGQESGFG